MFLRYDIPHPCKLEQALMELRKKTYEKLDRLYYLPIKVASDKHYVIYFSASQNKFMTHRKRPKSVSDIYDYSEYEDTYLEFILEALSNDKLTQKTKEGDVEDIIDVDMTYTENIACMDTDVTNYFY